MKKWYFYEADNDCGEGQYRSDKAAIRAFKKKCGDSLIIVYDENTLGFTNLYERKPKQEK